MSIQEVSAEQLAELFHHYHQAIAPDFGCPGKPDAEAWEQISQQERSRLVAAARLTLLELTSIAQNGKTQGGISQSRGKRNGAADKGSAPATTVMRELK